MAIFHYHAGIVSKAKGSILATAAYQSGSVLKDELTGIAYRYNKRKHVGHTQIIAPDGAPDWVRDPSRLFNAINQRNTRSDAQLAFNIEMALPIELDMPAWIELARKFTKPWTDRGQVLQISIHTNEGNPHLHILASQNELTDSGFGKKVREWSPEFRNGKRASADAINDDRKRWADLCNEALNSAGFADSATLHSGTLEEQGLTHQAGKHEGKWRHIKARESSSEPPIDLQQARLELERIAGEEKRIHLLLASFETELKLAKQAMQDLTRPKSRTHHPKQAPERPDGLIIVQGGKPPQTTTRETPNVHRHDFADVATHDF